MYENVAGIRSDVNAPGFKKIIMKPDLSDKVSYVKASHNSMYGTIGSDWNLDGKNFSWNIEVTVNTSALVYVPAESESKVMINGKSYNNAEGVTFIKMENAKAIFEIGSGKYAFVSTDVVVPKINEYVFSPYISPADTLTSNKSQMVEIKANNKEATILYTLDGSVPNEKSLVYTKPFSIAKSTTINAMATKKSLPNSLVTSSSIQLYDGTVNGWNYTYYEGDWKMLPDFSKEKIIVQGVCKDLEFEKINKREDFWGIVYSSNLWVDTESNYILYTTSDDGSRVFIDGKQIAIIDGTHGAQTATGKVMLTKGYHKIVVEYFEAIGGQSLEVTLQPEGGTRKKIPVSKLFLTAPKK